MKLSELLEHLHNVKDPDQVEVVVLDASGVLRPVRYLAHDNRSEKRTLRLVGPDSTDTSTVN
jgi:hypothetical protein